MIVITSVLNLFTAVMPTFSSWSLSFLLLMGIMRFLQGIPSGGELPGALCLLSERSNRENRRYLCSYLLVGPQIAQIVAMTQCYLMQKYCSHEFLIFYGWRISFLIAAMLGFLGVYVKKRLVESHLFLRLHVENRILKNPLLFSLKYYKMKIFLAFLLTMFEVVGFFLITFYAVENANKVFHIRIQDHLFMGVFVFIPIAFIMPLIGKIGDRVNNKQLYVLSTVGSILFSVLFYFSAAFSFKVCEIIFFMSSVIMLCFPFALLPSLIADLFPTKVRYTCIGLSFNVCDSIIGGVTPLLAYLLMQRVGGPASFVILLLFSGIIFLSTLPFIKLDEYDKSEIL